jgi:hypothetical protein
LIKINKKQHKFIFNQQQGSRIVPSEAVVCLASGVVPAGKATACFYVAP